MNAQYLFEGSPRPPTWVEAGRRVTRGLGARYKGVLFLGLLLGGGQHASAERVAPAHHASETAHSLGATDGSGLEVRFADSSVHRLLALHSPSSPQGTRALADKGQDEANGRKNCHLHIKTAAGHLLKYPLAKIKKKPRAKRIHLRLPTKTRAAKTLLVCAGRALRSRDVGPAEEDLIYAVDGTPLPPEK